MLVVAVASQKGGSGKTTLAGHIAVQADRTGAGPVIVVDTDPQGSLAAWWNARQAETPLYARTTVSELADDAQRMRLLGINLLIVDTPPAITATIDEVVKIADLVVIPTRPSPHDLRAAGSTVRLIERLAKPLVFVINSASPRARVTAEAAIALSQHGTVAPSIIHNRTDLLTRYQWSRRDPWQALAARFTFVLRYLETAWRDPSLPLELLPASWPAARAQEVAAALYQSLKGPLLDLGDRVLEQVGPTARAFDDAVDG